MLVPEAIVLALKPWSTLYGESTPISVGLTFAHLGSMMIGGGFAIAADRTVLRGRGPDDARSRVSMADALADVHRPVLIALGISAASGLLQLTADIETFAASRVMWTKTALLALLLVNGVLMLRNERAVRRAAGTNVGAASALRRRAMTSLVLWFAIVFAGVGLMQG
jgi:hypothetical protein